MHWRQLVMVALLLFSSVVSNASELPEKVRIIEPSTLIARISNSTAKERTFLRHLILANKALKTLEFFQSHRHALQMHVFFQNAFASNQIERTKSLFSTEELEELVRYVLVFEHNASPYDPYTNQKLLLKKSTPEQILKWLDGIENATEITRLMTNPEFETQEYPAPDGAGLEECGGNLYEHGLTSDEIKKALTDGLKLAPNGRVVRDPVSLMPTFQKLALSQPDLDLQVRAALETAVSEYKEALPFALSEPQKRQIEALISLLENGTQEAAMQMQSAFIEDPVKTPIRFFSDFSFGFYDYNQILSKINATILGVDPALTEQTQELARQAPYFEKKFPYGKWRRQFPANYRTPILMAYTLFRAAGEEPGLHLENPNHPEESINVIPYGLPEKQERDSKALRSLVLLHETLGHNSGAINPNRYKGKDLSMGPTGISMEEMRANLAAIVSFLDPRLLKIDFAANAEEQKNLLSAWLTQLFRAIANTAAAKESLAWPHLRANFFLMNYWIEKKVLYFENGEFVIPNLKKLVTSSRKLLKKVQRIRALRLEKKMEKLYARYAPLDATAIPWVSEWARKPRRPQELLIFQPFEFTPGCDILLLGERDKLETAIPGL